MDGVKSGLHRTLRAPYWEGFDRQAFQAIANRSALLQSRRNVTPETGQPLQYPRR
jgi:hypothetical protein